MTGESHVYVDGQTRVIRLELDGRSILCSSDDGPLARHPLHRLHRLSLGGHVLIHAQVLAALSMAGVPVAILAANGDTVALVPPRRRRNSNLGMELDNISPDHAARIAEDWRRSEISRHARGLRLDDPAAAARAGWRAPERLLRACQPDLHASTMRQPINETISFCRLLALRALHDAGIGPRWLGDGIGPDPDLCDLFAQIALWRLLRFAILPRLAARIRRAIDRDAGRGHDLAILLERARRPLSDALARDLHRFHLHLIDLRKAHRWHG